MWFIIRPLAGLSQCVFLILEKYFWELFLYLRNIFDEERTLQNLQRNSSNRWHFLVFTWSVQFLCWPSETGTDTSALTHRKQKPRQDSHMGQGLRACAPRRLFTVLFRKRLRGRLNLRGAHSVPVTVLWGHLADQSLQRDITALHVQEVDFPFASSTAAHCKGRGGFTKPQSLSW